MSQLYSNQQLREIFQSPFNQEAWKAILHNLFRAELIRKQAEKFTAEDDNEEGFYLGAHETSDSYRIGLFYFVIKTGSVAHKKVGLRNLVKQFVNPTWGEFDAAIVVFNDEKEWRLSFVCDIKDVKTAPKRYTFVFGEHDNSYRTAIERFLTIQNSEPSFENIRKAFSVDALSDDFFNTYREKYADFVQYITGKRYVKEGNKWVERELGKPNFQYTTTFDCDDKLVRDYVKKMFGRIVFLYFLQRKGWLNGDRQYMHNLFYGSTAKDNFLDGVLEPLFFEVLNTDKQYRTADANALPGSENIPYLNGGLFARDEIDELDCVFPEDYFKKLFDFLDSYNFTIDENDVDDAEIGIDPEMLGRIFENLLEDNKDKGAFYTPKEIVNYMCRESLIAYLQNGVPERSHDLIRNFVENCDASQLNAEQNKYLRKKLQDVKICDPAIGSGAFPMGLVNILSRLYIAMKADTDTSKMKRHIIENNIYGVDIEKGAVDIARLRFWLAMIVEEKEPMPLPNLHFKIMQGNSLLESINGIDLSDLTRTNAARSLFDSTDTERENLKTELSQYYNTSNHADRDRLFNEIINNVRRQIYAKDPNIDQKGLDPSANDKFFLWHTWFADVFDKGGFDIVIGNPPYIDSETMTLTIPDERKLYKSIFTTAQGNWDMFIVFIEHGISLTKQDGVFSYIVPNKVIAAKYASSCRNLIKSNNLLAIRDYGSVAVFEAAVYPCVLILKKQEVQTDKIFEQMNTLVEPLQRSVVPGDIFCRDLLWDKYFIKKNELLVILKVSSFSPLAELNVTICGAATVAEAYLIKDVLREKDDDNNIEMFKFINTGTIDKYESLWGKKKTQYIKGGYLYPVISKADLDSINSNRTIQAVSSKLIVAGMCYEIEALYDEGGTLAGKSTSIILGDNKLLKYVLALINSKLLNFWLRINYNSLKMSGGYINVGVNELGSLPISYNPNYIEPLSEFVDLINNNPTSNIIENIDHIVYHLYGLSYDEVLIVDPETPITREEYNNF